MEIKILCSRFTEISEVKEQCMAGPVQNAAVCSVKDELPLNWRLIVESIFCILYLRHNKYREVTEVK